MNSASDWIERLRLAPHPEGGFYRETYRAAGRLSGAGEEHPAGRSPSTAIYYLLRSTDVSRLHRLRSDELFHHHAGAALIVHLFHPGGRHETLRVGTGSQPGEAPQVVVPAGCWFGATVARPEAFALVSCTVAPGFEFADCEMAERETLRRLYPAHRELIETLT